MGAGMEMELRDAGKSCSVQFKTWEEAPPLSACGDGMTVGWVPCWVGGAAPGKLWGCSVPGARSRSFGRPACCVSKLVENGSFWRVQEQQKEELCLKFAALK